MAGVEDGNRILALSSGVADGMISVAIADTGGGISPADRERVFETLYTTKGAGLGLGLSICRKIVKLHGGQLWVEENGRCGAKFTFALPLRQAVQTSESR
jgi:signal transduction histidine kinase